MNNEKILLTAYSCSLPNGRLYTERQTCESPRFAVELWRCRVTEGSDLSETFFVQRVVTSATMSERRSTCTAHRRDKKKFIKTDG